MTNSPEPPTQPDPTEPESYPIEPRCFCGRLLEPGGICPTHGGSIDRRIALCDHEWVSVTNPESWRNLVRPRTLRCAKGCGASRVQA